MAIIPKGGFQRRVNINRRPANISDDGAAKPYRALADLGSNFATIAGEMFEKSRRDADISETNKALDSLSQTQAAFTNQMKTDIDDDGLVTPQGRGAAVPYSQAWSEAMDRQVEEISAGMTSESARFRFRTAAARSIREGKVGSINFEQGHKTKRYAAKAGKDVLSDANSYGQREGNVNADALAAFRRNQKDYAERNETQRISESLRSKLESQSGIIHATTAAHNAITRVNVEAFGEIIGKDILQDEEIDNILQDPEFQEEGVILNQFFKNREDKEEAFKRYEELRKFLTPEKRRILTEKFLKAMKNNTRGKMSGLNTRWSWITASMGDVDNHRGGKAEALNEQLKTLMRDSGEAGMVPPDVINKTSFAIAAKASAISAERMARFAGKPGLIERIKNQTESVIMREIDTMFGDNPEFAETLRDPSLVGSMKKSVDNFLSSHQVRLNNELNKEGADYAVKYNTDIANDWQNASDPATTHKAMDKTAAVQSEAGLAQHKVKRIPTPITEKVGAEIDRAFNAGDEKQMVTNQIIALKAQYGDKFPELMQLAVERKHLKNPAIAQASWINDNFMLRRTLKDLHALPQSAKRYEASNKTEKGARIFNLDFKSNALITGKLAPFLQLGGIRGKQRFEHMQQLIMARFYAMKEGTPADKNDEGILNQAYDDTVGRLFGIVPYGNSQMVVPKSLNIPESTARAAAKTLLRDFSSREIDFEKLPAINAAYVGRGYTTDKRKQEEFMNEYGNRLIVCTPPVDGSGAVMRVCMNTTRGVNAVPMKKRHSEDSIFTEYKLNGIKSDVLIQGTEARDAKFILGTNFEELRRGDINLDFSGQVPPGQ